MLTAPLIGMSGLLLVAPMDPVSFASLCRSCLKVLAINISFAGGVHLGFAATQYETAATDDDHTRVNLMFVYSYVPTFVAYKAGNSLLFAQPLFEPACMVAFGSLLSV